jgi:hypothetical protein
MRYGLVTSDRLFEIVQKALEGDEAAVATFRSRLLAAEGEVAPEEPAGSPVEAGEGRKTGGRKQ